MPSPPALHGPSVPSYPPWNSPTDRTGMTQFCSPGESVSSSGILSNSSTINRRVPASIPTPFPSKHLPSSFAAQSMDKSSDVWIGDSGVSCYMTNDASSMYCVRPFPSDQREVTSSDGIWQRVEYVGNINVVFHGRSDEPITLCDVSYVQGLRFNIFSFQKAQQTHVIILDTVVVHIVGKNLTFPCEKSGSYLRASRLTPGTVEEKARTNRALASQISTPLSSCVLPSSQSVPTRAFQTFQGFRMCRTFRGPMQRMVICCNQSPLPLLFPCWGKLFGINSLFELDCSLAAAAMNPGMLKHGKVVDMKHLYVSLAHAHASVLQATSTQHGFQVTGDLVSCSAYSIAKGNRGPTAHHTTVRAKKPMEMVHIYTTALSRHLSGDRGTSLYSWTAPLASSVPTVPATRVRPP